MLVTAGVAAGVGSAIAVLLLAIVILITVTASVAVVKSCKRKGECYFEMTGLSIVQVADTIHYTCTLLTANNDPEEPYYSTVCTGQPDAIPLKENDAYGSMPPTPQQVIIVDDNPAYRVTGQNGSRNRQNC